MIVATPRRVGEISRKAFDILLARGNGMPVQALLEEIDSTLPLSPWERTSDIYHGMKPFEEMAYAAAIPLTKAGWMQQREGIWSVTEKGRQAYAEITDPEEFIRESANQSLKGWTVIHAPRLFSFLSRIKSQFDIERQMIARMGPRLLFSTIAGKTPVWQKWLPIQMPRRFAMPGVNLKSYDDLISYFDSHGVDYRCAGHTVYLSPEAASAAGFTAIMSQYPPDAGLKITKNPGRVDSPYLFGSVRNRKISVMYNRMTYNRAQLVLVANLLFSRDLTARLYDLIEIECGQTVFTAYVVRHLAGQQPTEAECEAGIDQIKQLEREGLLKVTLSQGYDDEDFSSPTCNNNAFIDDGKFCYVDFQSFLLIEYEKYLREVRDSAYDAANEHGGSADDAPGNAGEFGTSEAWDDQPKFTSAKHVLQEAGITIKDRAVFDIGCGTGTNIAGYLRSGAAWCVGWDTKPAIKAAERLLLALGCTRFSLLDFQPDRELSQQIPPFLRLMARGSIVSISGRYPAHVLDVVEAIPCDYLIVDSEANDLDDLGAVRAALEAAWLRPRGSDTYTDIDGTSRVVRVFERKPRELVQSEMLSQRQQPGQPSRAEI